jgi:hypothetical protein
MDTGLLAFGPAVRSDTDARQRRNLSFAPTFSLAKNYVLNYVSRV